MQKIVVGCIVFIVLAVSGGLLAGGANAAERDRPIRIGVLTSSWGPTPQTVGLRDGLLELGYQEDDDFVIGVRFTQGDLAALPAAARELVQHGADIIFAAEDQPAKAVQQATAEVPENGTGLTYFFHQPVRWNFRTPLRLIGRHRVCSRPYNISIIGRNQSRSRQRHRPHRRILRHRLARFPQYRQPCHPQTRCRA